MKRKLSPKQEKELEPLLKAYKEREAIIKKLLTAITQYRIKHFIQIPEGQKIPEKHYKRHDAAYDLYLLHLKYQIACRNKIRQIVEQK